MSDKDVTTLYDGPPIWARMVSWLLLGMGGIVLVPIALLSRAWWLLVPAVPLILAGLLLLQTRLHIIVERRTGVVRVANSWLGLMLRERQYPLSDVVGFDIQRVAGDERERPSDTWYLRLQLRTRTHIIGKYDSRLEALEARRRLSEVLQARPSAQTAVSVHSRPT